MCHVSLLEQSLDSMEDDNDHAVTKQHVDAQAVTRQCVRLRATVHNKKSLLNQLRQYYYIDTLYQLRILFSMLLHGLVVNYTVSPNSFYSHKSYKLPCIAYGSSDPEKFYER